MRKATEESQRKKIKINRKDKLFDNKEERHDNALGYRRGQEFQEKKKSTNVSPSQFGRYCWHFFASLGARIAIFTFWRERIWLFFNEKNLTFKIPNKKYYKIVCTNFPKIQTKIASEKNDSKLSW